MSSKFYCASMRMPLQPYSPVSRRPLLIAVLILLFHAGPSWSGECLMSDEDLFKDVVSFAESAKRGGMGSPYHGSDLYCWRGDMGLDAKLRGVLTDMLFDSRIHPAHVAAALSDYQSVFGDPKALLGEVQKKQGRSRYAIISAVREGKGAAFPATAAGKAGETFPGDVDFIDGPANIRKEPKGALAASLPDNAKVRVLRKQDSWVEIESDGVRGWTAATNLMGNHIGRADADGFYVLSRAAFMGYAETVRFLLSRGARADLVDGFGRNALHWAVRGGFAGLDASELEMVKLLSAVPGVNVNLVDKEGMTPLLAAITLGRMDMAKVLLGMGSIDVNVPGREGVTPLSHAIEYRRTDMVGALVDARGLNVDAVDERGRTALYHAVALGDQKSVAALLERKARTETVTKDGKTLLHALFEPKYYRLTPDRPNSEVVKLLLACKEIDVNREDAQGNTAMALAIEQDWPDVVKLFLARPDLDVNRPTRDGGRYLRRVIGLSNLRHGYEMAMLMLDREEIDVNAPMYHGETVVHMGWYNSGMGTYGLDMAKKILARRPDLNRENEYGETPLVYNINQNRPEMVLLLSRTKGVELNWLSREDRTPLGHARNRGKTEMIEILQSAGAREFPLVGDEERTPEGIPQSLLQNDMASRVIVDFRWYLLSSTNKTLNFLRDKKTNDAVQLQESILDKILVEVGNSTSRYSVEQRKRVVGTLGAIRDHYRRHPRSQSAWYTVLSDEKKKIYAEMDVMRDEILGGKYDAAPDGDLANYPPAVPILILRDYMARNSIKALSMLKAGKTTAAEEFLKDVARRSDQKGYLKE